MGAYIKCGSGFAPNMSQFPKLDYILSISCTCDLVPLRNSTDISAIKRLPIPPLLFFWSA